ncbi:MAG: pre-rRNA-processing protein TSR3 [Planctomycetota bacterium]|jgi:pre-rRNA-processing protein TSR3
MSDLVPGPEASAGSRSSLDVLIVRDPRESPKKCSLIPLRGTAGIEFVAYEGDRMVDATGRVLLDPEGELISEADRGLPLLVLDSSWRRLPKLAKTITGDPVRRRLPPLVTAYPRRSKGFEDPSEGLASVEALYAALLLLGATDIEYLLDDYLWKTEFLDRNRDALKVPQ